MDRFLVKAANLTTKGGGKTLLKIADIAIELGFSSMPVAGALYGFSKAGLEAARDYVQRRNINRLIGFHRELLFRDDLIDRGLTECEIDAAEFHALLDACVSDIEEEKTAPYAMLARSIALNVVPVTHRRHFIHSLKELSFEHLDILREVYVVTKYSCVSQNDRLNNSRDLISQLQLSSISELAVDLLIVRRMITTRGITPLGVSFIEACYSECDLSPCSFDYKMSRKERGVVVKLVDNAEIQEVEKSLISELRGRFIQAEVSGIGRFDGAASDDPCIRFADYAFIISKQGVGHSQAASETLSRSLLGKKCLQVFVGPATDQQEQSVSLIDAPLRVVCPGDSIQAAAAEMVDFILSLG
ncbi:hypothetical protein [Pseudomonas nitroreducens]|uniref:hypothetical protein n=1 Tax=Pseudomonas nitroreducens TaxID=46680 RepID=UPI00265A76DD|nr:hypothetical protein [Pseudomonas nitroreducens]MCP1649319.1 hypothetical protein [Pseudomonas nitroreducens]MCP1684720.1 hypothetical protein [Pseudomonas nitroreducens]